MIYDKNQFFFNIGFAIMLVVLLVSNIFLLTGFKHLREDVAQVNGTVGKVRDSQVFNHIQGAHYDLDYQLTAQGFYVISSTDYGLFNGPSMQPAIFDGNTLIEKAYLSEDLEEGQVIRFLRDDGTAVIHRVRADYGDQVFVQGDSLDEGEIISKSQITHTVVGILYT